MSMSVTVVVPARLDDLVFARFATSPRPPAHAEVVAALRADAPATYEEARWSTAIFEATARLRATGAIDTRGVVADGAAAAAARFGATGTPTWRRLHERIVPALALGVAADDARAHGRLASRDAWVGATLGRALGLWTSGPAPSLGAVCDALVWRALGLSGRPARSPSEIRAHFVGQVLATAVGSVERRAALLAAREVGAVRADVRALREALVRRWLCGQVWTAPVDADEPARFAATVKAAATRAMTGTFGDRKVFIASLWRDSAFVGIPLDQFKARLLAAHQAGAIRLARADLVAAMDPALVRESELPHLEATYHFVERGPT